MDAGKHTSLLSATGMGRTWAWLAIALFPTIPLFGQGLSGTIDGSIVTIEGSRPGAPLVLMAVSREWNPAGVRVERIQQDLADTDGDGILRYEAPATIPTDSVWVALDPATADSLVLIPKEGQLRKAELLAEDLLLDAETGLPVLSIREFAELVLFAARPGVGLYQATASDGGHLDLDLENNAEIRADLSKLGSTAGLGDQLGSLRGDEVLFGIDPRSLTLVTVSSPLVRSAGGSR